MKYPCGVIKDLLPLYIDNVCNAESKKIVIEHLEECEECKNYCSAMTSVNNYPQNSPDSNDEILADSLKKVKKQIKAKHIMVALVSILIVIIFAGISMLAIDGMKHTEYVVLYENNISLSHDAPEEWSDWYDESQDQFIIYCQGRTITGMSSKLIEIPVGDKTEQILFFQTRTNRWEDFITQDNDMSYQPLASADSGIDKIYYYPGYMQDIEMLAEGELEIIIDTSTLLWESDK